MQQMRTHVFDPFDRDIGSGSGDSVDDVLDNDSIFDNEWGSAAATTFDPTGTDGKGNSLSDHRKRKMKQLYERHNGKGEQSRRGQIRQSHMKNDLKTFCSVLELTDLQEERVRSIFTGLDSSSRNFSGQSYESVILAICTLVTDEQLSNRKNASLDQRLLFSDQFRELMDVTGTSSSDIRQVRPKIRKQASYFSAEE